MRKPQNISMSSHLLSGLQEIGIRISRMRKARRLLQAEAAVRANISRETASRIENGDASVAIGQIVRYLDVIATGVSLARFYEMKDAALSTLESAEKRQRAQTFSKSATAI